MSNRKTRPAGQPARRRWRRTLGWSLAAAMVGTGGWLLFGVAHFEWQYHQVGGHLESTIARIVKHPAASPKSCEAQASGQPGIQVDGFDLVGNLVAPAISLNAPVVEGTDDAQLAVAVGHDPSSAWPSTQGTSVFSAHDVTWFSGLDQLELGAALDFETACTVYQYAVISKDVVPAGTNVPSGATPLLALVTCYPLNALYLTPNRLLIEAQLVRVEYRPSVVAEPQAFLVPTVPAPPGLASQGLDLAHNALRLGTLSVSGEPSPSWSQSATPLRAHVALLALYLGAVKSAEQDQPAWWQALAPGLPISAAQPLVGRSTSGVEGLDATLTVADTVVTGGSISGTLRIARGPTAGPYDVSMTATVIDGSFLITSFQMTMT